MKSTPMLKVKIIWGIVFMMMASVFYYFFIGGHLEGKSVLIGLKKNDKVYLMPFPANRNILEEALRQNTKPIFHKSFNLIEEDGTYYMDPNQLESLVHLIADDYILYDQKEPSFDGYVLQGMRNLYSFGSQIENTKVKGEQVQHYEVTLHHNITNQTMEIGWLGYTKVKPLQNCVVKKIKDVTNPFPGTSIGSVKETIVVDLQDILDFYNNGNTLEYNEEENVLYVISKD